jgi:hypothetical protein
LLNLFRINSIFAFVCILLFTLVLRISPFFHPVTAIASPNTPLAQYFYYWFDISAQFSFTQYIITSLLVFTQALLVHFMASTHTVLFKTNPMPALFFVIINSIFPEQLFLSPQLIANTFLLFMLFRLFYLYESESPILLVFDAGLFLGFGLQFTYDVWIYLPFIVTSIVTLTSFSIRYLLIAIIGMLLPAYFVGILFYLTDQFGSFLQSFQYSIQKNYFNPLQIDAKQMLPFAFMLIPLIRSLFNLQHNYFRNKVKTRRVQLSIGVLFLFGLLSLVVENEGFKYALPFLATPLSFLLANYFNSEKRFWFKELVFYGILVSIALIQFGVI